MGRTFGDKMAKKKLEITHNDLVNIKPITENQKRAVAAWKNNKHLFLYGVAGTGKTFLSLNLALKEVLNEKTEQQRVYIVRSLLPTRDIGFLPGDEEDKAFLYQMPYQNMVRFMFQAPSDNAFERLYVDLRNQGTIEFLSTSFLRGITIDNGIIIVDEAQNLNFHELDTIITRVGQNSRIIFCGDFQQTDLNKTVERNGIYDFQRILFEMGEFENIEFDLGDIVRSGFLRNYLVNKIKLGLHYDQT
jgi:predicted ribonuclease YlaK